MNLRLSFPAFLLAAGSLLSACASLNPAKQADILKNYHYQVESVSNMMIAGRSAQALMDGQRGAAQSLSGLALGILRKDLPLEAMVNMRVSNPTNRVSAINAFQYLVEINGKAFFEGTVDRVVRLEQGQSTVVPLTFKANLFGVVDEQRGIEGLLSDLLTREGEGLVVLKIKPSIHIAGNTIFYPGYITIDNNLLQRLDRR